jgi:hypothetical protein
VKFDITLGELHWGEILVLPVRGLHVKHAVQRGIWVPNQHLLLLLQGSSGSLTFQHWLRAECKDFKALAHQVALAD